MQTAGPIAVPAVSESGLQSSGIRVITGASLGTLIEWYDFFLYGSLATIVSKQFFAGVNEVTGFVLALATFAAGFAVRPLGALVFGRLGDLIGRKRTFLATIAIMGSATVLVGLLPTYAQVGVAAPITLLCLRLLQGLAIGGEYGGAAVYVAEHAPATRRGEYTSWIQATSSLGLLASLLVILLCRAILGPDFEIWGWRIPFLLSVVLLAISVWVRVQLAESPVFQQMVASGSRSKAPLAECLGQKQNRRRMVAVLFGACAGMTVVFYCSQYYALFFLTQILKVDAQAADLLIAAAILIATPAYVFCGWLADRIGRKPVIVSGCLIAAITYFPLYHAITHYANPALDAAAAGSPVTVFADKSGCSFQFDPIGRKKYSSSCDIVRVALTKAGVPYTTVELGRGAVAHVRIGVGSGAAELQAFEGGAMTPANFRQASEEFNGKLGAALSAAGYMPQADTQRINYPMVLLILTVLVSYAALAYAPLAAWMVELFPARIRYSSVSIPYHFAVGWLGGFLPTVAYAIVVITGDLYAGLWYAVAIAALSAVVGIIFLPETVGTASIDAK